MSRQLTNQDPPQIPNGWFAVAWSKDVTSGEVKRIRYFNEELVLFRTRQGVAAVLDAYCVHLGAHLGEGGRVVGETVRCPFHGWSYDTSGACVEIPYCKKIPPKARLRGWEVVERNQMIFVWHHAEDKPPDWEVPEISELQDATWTDPRSFEIEVPAHMQDMAENNCDPVHFHYVHGAPEMTPTETEYAADGRFFRAVSRGERELPGGGTIETELVRDTWSLGISSVYLKGIPGAGLYMFSSTSPVDREHTVSRWLLTVTENMADVAGEEFIQGLTTGVLQDMRIWKNKIHRAQPILCEEDGFLAEFRRWAKQFYSNA